MTEQNQTPPWGDDANFDASKAWSLIQNLRAEVDGLKTAKTALAAERDDALAKVQGAEDDLARVRAESEQAVKDAQEVADQRRAELEQVVRQLESGTSDLETSIALWERGEALAARCEAWLKGAQERLNAVRGEQNPVAN